MKPLFFDLHRHRLDNGLEVVLHPDPSAPLVAVNLWYHAGSKNERRGRTGLAHLFEHMLFQGSQHVGTNDHFRRVQQVGGVANGSTWFDRTNYYETLPSQHLELGLWLESDRMGFLLPALTSEKLENQRDVVMNERRERIDNQPYGLAFERLHETLYPENHPYHWPVIGYMEDIAAATLDDVQAFFSTYYRPNNAVLTLAGDIDPDSALEKVAHWFDDLPAGDTPPAIAKDFAPSTGGERIVLEDKVELSRAYMAWQVPPFGNAGWYAANMLCSILTGGKASRLYHDLVYERQMAQDVSAFVFPTEEIASLAIVATCRPGTDPEELEKRIGAHLQALSRSAPPREEIERARSGLLTSFCGELESLESRADLLGQMTTFFDDPARLASEPDRLAQVSAEHISQAAGLCLQEMAATVVVVPKESR